MQRHTTALCQNAMSAANKQEEMILSVEQKSY